MKQLFFLCSLISMNVCAYVPFDYFDGGDDPNFYEPCYYTDDLRVSDDQDEPLDDDSLDLYEYYDIANNPLIPTLSGKRMAPYLLPLDHPVFEQLDASCHKRRVFYNGATFKKAGYKKVTRKRSFLVGYHKSNKNYIVKGKPDIESIRRRPLKGFINRAKTSARMHEVIAANDLKCVAVPHKWIYPLPLSPKPYEKVKWPSVVIVVADYIPVEELKTTRRLWGKESSWTAEMIEDMFTLLYNVPLSDCTMVNVRFTKDRKRIAFFDLEFPGRNLNQTHKRLIHYLPEKWKNYWYELFDEAEAQAAEDAA